jgi:serine/threonine protein kinase
MEPFINVDTICQIITHKSDITDTWIVSCIAQVAQILWILETSLGFNHRDLKGNNVLVSDVPTGTTATATATAKSVQRCVDYKGISIKVNALMDVHLVDFGFACSGRGQSGTDIGATNYFPCTDPCPKMGRDIFQLCTFLYMSPKLRALLGAKLATLFEKWLTLPGKDFPAYLRSKKEVDTDWVYFLLSSSRFHAEACEPLTILTDIYHEYPNIVEIDIS